MLMASGARMHQAARAFCGPIAAVSTALTSSNVTGVLRRAKDARVVMVVNSLTW